VSACNEIRALLGRYVDGELGPADVSRIDSHVSVCEACAEELRLMEREADLLRAALAPEAAPEHLCANLWSALQEPPARSTWIPLRWAAAAAAAVILVAWFVGLVVTNGGPGVKLARVTSCAGPLEIRHAGEDWAPLATYTMLRHGDRVRCGSGNAGSLIVDGDSRFDLDAGTDLVFASDVVEGSFRITMERGRLHARFPSLTQPFNIFTPVVNVVATNEATDAAGPTEIEIALTGVPPALGLLDRIHLLPAAYAAADEPQLELLVYEGAALLVTKSGLATAVTPGHRIVVGADGPMPEPAAFDVSARRAWWPSDLRAAIAMRPAEPRGIPDAAVPPAGKPDGAAAPPPKAGGTGTNVAGPVRPVPADAKPVDGPPAPKGLVARADIDAVLLTWRPVNDGTHPVVEYGIYRRAPGDTEFALIGRFPVIGDNIQTYVFRDAGLGIGAEYQYAVAAATRNKDGDDLIEGKLSNVTTGSAADFHLYYTGGNNKDLAIIVVEKRHGDDVRRQTFMVRKRDPAAGQSGRIGEPRQIVIEPVQGAKHRVLIDFSTGYRLADIITAVDHKDGIPRERSSIIIENGLGMRKTILRNGVRP